jgi:hypothetical protein
MSQKAKFRPEDLLCGQESRESHVKFIQTNWPIDAAFAWQQYQNQGRGCLVADVSKSKDPPPGDLTCLVNPYEPYVPGGSGHPQPAIAAGGI